MWWWKNVAVRLWWKSSGCLFLYTLLTVYTVRKGSTIRMYSTSLPVTYNNVSKLSVRMHSIAYINPFLQVLSARHMLSEKVSSYFDDTFFTVCKLMSCVGCQHNNSSKHISCTYYRAYRLLPALIIRHN